MHYFPGVDYERIPDLPYELWLSCTQWIDQWERRRGVSGDA